MSEHPLDPLLAPRSIALLGASARADTPGAVLADMIFNSGYDGDVFPVNPRYQQILGRDCHAELAALPLTVDHVVIALGNERLEEALDATIAHGARAATIYASGVLADDGEPRLGKRLADRARAAGLQICGLNGMGFYNPPAGLYAGIFPRPRDVQAGRVSYIAQSGSAFTALCHNGRRLGFNLCVSTGNELTATVADYLDWCLAHDDTRVIGLYLETVRDPDGFVAALARARDLAIPVVALKLGKSPLGASMALTHTGAIAGSHAAFEALFRRYGVIEVDDLDELAATLMLLQGEREPAAGGLAAVFESGGLRGLVSDTAHALGVEFAPLETATRSALKAHLEPGLEADNPLDAWGTHERFEERFTACLRLLLADPNVGAGIFVSNLRDGYYLSEAIYRAVEAAAAASDKPVALGTCYADLANDELCRRAYAAGIPLLDGARETLLAFRHLFELRDFHRHRDRPVEIGELDRAHVAAWRERLERHSQTTLGEADALALLTDFDLPVITHRVVDNEPGLLAAADEIGYPLVLKTAVPGIDHKSDRGGVFVGIGDEAELRARYADLVARLGAQVLVAQMAPPGVEVGLGTLTDPQFGPLVMVAAGGILIELLADRGVALCPVDATEAEALLASLAIDPLLRGARGKPAADRASLVEIIVGLSQLAVALRDQIESIDVNPVFAGVAGAVAVDALVALRR